MIFPEILVDNIDNADSENPEDGQIRINLDQNIKTVFDLRKKIANEFGFEKDEEIDFISLFIFFQTRELYDFAVLGDNEQIVDILIENPNEHINYKIKKELKSALRPNFLKKYRQMASKLGLELDDDAIKIIHKRANGDMDIILATFNYMASKKSK